MSQIYHLINVKPASTFNFLLTIPDYKRTVSDILAIYVFLSTIDKYLVPLIHQSHLKGNHTNLATYMGRNTV